MNKLLSLRIRFVSVTYMRFSMILLVLCSLLSVSRASAMSQYSIDGLDVFSPLVPYATAYPTLTPISATATYVNPLSTIDASCPVGAPVGYGTVTPSIDWLYTCSMCLPTGTPQSFFTSTAGPTFTPVFAETPAPICVTPDGGGDEVCSTPTSVPTYTPSPTVVPTTTSSPDYTGIVWDQTACSGSWGSMSCDFPTPKLLHFVFSGEHIQYYSSFPFYVIDTLSRTQDINTHFYWNVDLNGRVDSGGPDQCFGWNFTSYFQCGSLGSSVSGDYEQIIWGASGHLETFDTWFNPNYWGYRDVEGWISIDDPYNPEATPSPTPVVTGTPSTSCSTYCGCVSNQSVPNIFSFNGSGRPVRQQCVVTPELSLPSLINLLISPFSILAPFAETLSSIVPSQAVLDPVTVCVRERDYSLYLFGIRFPIETIVGMIIFLSGLRFFVPTVFSGASVIGQNTPTVTTSTTTSSRVGSTRTSKTTTSPRRKA